MSTKQKLEKKVHEMTKALIKHYNPEVIALFGSVATGKIHKDSDIDLLIIKKTTEKDQIKRIRYVFEVIDNIRESFPIDIKIYTPDEFQQRYQIGDYFVHEIVETSKILYSRYEQKHKT